MELVRESIGERLWLNRGDIGFGNDEICRWHEQPGVRPKYLFKLKLTSNVHRAMAQTREEDWQEPSGFGVWQVAEGSMQLTGWSRDLHATDKTENKFN